MTKNGSGQPRPRVATDAWTTDRIRKLIVERTHEAGHTMQSVSEAIGRSKGMMWSYVYRGSPRTLHPELCVKLAVVLEIAASDLMPRLSDAPDRFTALATASAADPGQAKGDTIPLFRQADAIVEADATNFTRRPLNIPRGQQAIAIEMTDGCLRTRAGDVLVATDMVAVPGDLVVCIDLRHRIIAFGELVHTDGAELRLSTGATLTNLQAIDVRMMKVATTLHV